MLAVLLLEAQSRAAQVVSASADWPFEVAHRPLPQTTVFVVVVVAVAVAVVQPATFGTAASGD